jgi:hypothetical protein
MRKEGVDMKVRMKVHGHKTAKTSMRYDYIDDADQLEAAKKVLKVRADKGKTADVKLLDNQRLVPVERIELPTFGLQNRCSTAELNRQVSETIKQLADFGKKKTICLFFLSPRRGSNSHLAGFFSSLASLPSRGWSHPSSSPSRTRERTGPPRGPLQLPWPSGLRPQPRSWSGWRARSLPRAAAGSQASRHGTRPRLRTSGPRSPIGQRNMGGNLGACDYQQLLGPHMQRCDRRSNADARPKQPSAHHCSSEQHWRHGDHDGQRHGARLRYFLGGPQWWFSAGAEQPGVRAEKRTAVVKSAKSGRSRTSI